MNIDSEAGYIPARAGHWGKVHLRTCEVSNI